MNLQENIVLRDHSTFRLGGPARFFVAAHTTEDLRQALLWARKKKSTYFILGGGSNLLFSDKGFNGLVIKPQLLQLSFNGTGVTVGATVALSELISRTLDRKLTGLEFAAGIPGTVGGAIRGNAGTYGVSMSDVLTSITYLDEATFNAVTLSAAQCGFAYRHSMFKLHTHSIVEAHLTLKSGAIEASRKIITDRIALRHQSHPLEPSAGCIFKNVEFDRVDLKKLATKDIDLSRFEQYRKIPSGYLIERLGLKGKRIGGAMISPKHANYIINVGSATSEDVVTMVSFIKQQVRDAYGIQLEEEVQIVPES